MNFYIGHWEAGRDVKSIANEWAEYLIKAGIKAEHRLIILACESNELAKELSIAISKKGQNVKVTGALGLAYEYWWDFSSPHNHEVQIDPKHKSVGKLNESKDKTLKQWIEMRYDSLILMDMLNYLLKILNEENCEKLDVDNINLLCAHLGNKEFQQFNPHSFEGPFSEDTKEKISEKGTHKISLVKLLKIPEENQCKTSKAKNDRNKKIQQNNEKKEKMRDVLSSEIDKGLIYNAPDKVPLANQHMINLMKDWKNIEDKNEGLSHLYAYLARECNKIWTSIAANRYVDELVSAYQGDIPNEKGGSQLKEGWITYEKGEIVSKNTHWRDITG
ncbi:MAG TPA: hypothetical protein DEQ30_00075 [Porphyromonadaceae bacterium]|nr:hypothetical protein [Porphyromonadaceae bacterium]